MNVRPLTPDHCRELAPRMRAGDIVDCAAHDHDPLAALLVGREIGPAWALLAEDGGGVMGAAGFSASHGTIWSLWADDLSNDDKRWIMQNTAAGVRSSVIQAGTLLGNYVWEGNRLTLAWLRASHCFYIDLLQRHPYKGHNYILFMAKPLEELPY